MIRRFMRLSPSERSLLKRVVLLLTAIRIGLFLVPFSLLRRVLLAAAIPRDIVHVPVERLVWAVRVASRPVPAATCLTQSLALQFLLACSGRPSTVRIGVIKDGGSGFQAHAWVECAGQTLLDRPEEVARYTPLASWEVA
jgi:hypothetical protein